MNFKNLSAVALIAGSATSANAAIVSFIDVDIPIPTTYAGVSVNLETGAFETDLDGIAGGDMNFLFGGEWITNDADQSVSIPTWQPVRVGTGNSDTIAKLGLTAIVGPTGTLPAGLDYSTGYGGSVDHISSTPTALEFSSPGERGYIGFSVELADTTIAYGWADVTLRDDNTPGMIHSWAFQDDGSPLQVGVPEPSQSILVMIGMLATALRRRRVSPS